MYDIFNNKCRNALAVMLAAKADEERETQRVSIVLNMLMVNSRAHPINC